MQRGVYNTLRDKHYIVNYEERKRVESSTRSISSGHEEK
jgi:hypothetical protein